MRSYGISDRKETNDKVDYHAENIKRKGFSVEPCLIDECLCLALVEELETVYQQQEKSFGQDNLCLINELDTVRAPFLYKEIFFDLFLNNVILNVVEKVLGKVFQLSLQNGIINRPKNEHHQVAWHRDLPYQDWVISKPVAINAFYCISEFTSDNGSTVVLPYSQHFDYFPNKQFVCEEELQVLAPRGSVIFFDSMLYHRAGINLSKDVRYGINHMFSLTLIKQQIDIASHFSEEKMEDRVAQILGLTYQTPTSVDDFRHRRLRRIESEND